MRGISSELKVGIFALIVLLVLAVMTFKTGGLEWTKKKGYTLYASFDNTAGLDEQTKIKVAGVDTGIVDEIELVEGRARVKLLMNEGVVVYKNARALIRSTGLLGDKFLEIQVGSPDNPPLKDGDEITSVIELVDIDDLARNVMNLSQNFTKFTETLNEILGSEENKKSLSQTISNLREITSSLNNILSENDQRLRTALDNINELVVSLNTVIEENRQPLADTIANLDDFSGKLNSKGPEIIENLSRASSELKELVEENRPGIARTVKAIDDVSQKIEKGEGSLGKLIKDDRLYESINQAADGLNKTLSAVDRFKTFLTFQAEYLTKPKDGKGYFYVTLQPREDKYYILGVVGDPLGSVSTKERTITPPGSVVTEEVVKKKIEFTAQIAKRFGDFALRAGLTENTFGAGGDYFFYDDKVKISTDVWDFSNDEEGSKNPHLKIGIDYFLFKHLFISAGADNILNDKWRGGYLGMGLRFEDEDFKYLLGTVPSVSRR